MCLQRARALGQQIPVLDQSAFSGLWDLLVELRDEPMDDPCATLLAETILMLQTFIPSHSEDLSGFPVLRDGKIQIGGLIHLAVEILQGDFTSLADGRWRWSEDMRFCITALLLSLWRRMDVDNEMSFVEFQEIFIASCRLWAPLEEKVEVSRTGTRDRRHDWVTRGKRYDWLEDSDLETITRFIKWIQTRAREFDWTTSAFISRNADVGINRLCVWLKTDRMDTSFDWEYHLYDLREQRVLCSRLTYIDDGTL